MNLRRNKGWLALLLVAVLLGASIVQIFPSGCANMVMTGATGKSAPCHDSMPSCLLAGGCVAVPVFSADATGGPLLLSSPRYETYVLASNQLTGRSIAPDIRPPISAA
jgi:hypothetical protein